MAFCAEESPARKSGQSRSSVGQSGSQAVRLSGSQAVRKSGTGLLDFARYLVISETPAHDD